MRFVLRNGFADDVVILDRDRERIESNLFHRGRSTDHMNCFVVFDSGEWAYAISFRHLIYCQFVPGGPAQPSEDDCKARIYLANQKEPIELGLDPAPPRGTDGEEMNQIEDLFFTLQGWDSEHADERVALTDEDEDTAYFRIDDIAMVMVNRSCRDAG
jgi:hypothetical protein